MAQFVFLETFAEILGGRRVKNFGEILVGNVAEGDLSAVIQTACYNSSIMQNGHMGVKRAARTCGGFYTSFV